jgi:murein DD-endopeptidase MepM/ murein hydrolase activator NlpD
MNRSRGSSIRRLRHLAGALIVLLALLPPARVGATDTEQELNRARRALQELRREHRDTEARAREIRAGLESLIRQVSQLTVQKEALSTAVHETEGEIRHSNRRVDELQGTLNERARDVYIRGPAGALELVLEARSLPELSDRFSFLNALSRGDANVAAGLQTQREEATALRRNLKEYERALVPLLDQLAGQRAELEVKWAEMREVSADLEEAVAEQQDLVKRLEKKVQREYLAQYGIQGGGTVGPPVGADGPFYWCPVDPPRSYIDDFGFPRVGHTHQGNDIFAPAGTPIRAPFAGRAEESFNGLGGTSVHVYAEANADFVYNAHLSQHVGVDGQHVNPGDVIGLVGNTGNAAGTPPHDHFEYHPGGGSAVSPYLYLNEVCGVNGGG